MPATQRSANSRVTLASSRIDSSRLRAITGRYTLSSKLPCEPAKATAASLPITWATTWVTASASTGLTLPGMIDEPGWRSGRRISARPVRGPLAIQRMSLAILTSATASARSSPDRLDQAVPGAVGGEVVGRLGQRQVQVRGQPGDHGGRTRRALMPGAHGGAAERQLADRGQRRADGSAASSTWAA